jgi:hypothetical protein
MRMRTTGPPRCFWSVSVSSSRVVTGMPASSGDAGGADGMLGGWRSKEISGDSSSRYTVRVPAHPSQLGREGPGRGEPGSLRGPDACREGTVQGERRHARPGGAVSGGRPQGERHAPAACGQLCQRQGNCGHLRSAGGSGPGFTFARLGFSRAPIASKSARDPDGQDYYPGHRRAHGRSSTRRET